MHTVKMNLENVAKLIVRYCQADHIEEEDKCKFVLDTLWKAQKAVLEKNDNSNDTRDTQGRQNEKTEGEVV